MAEKRDRGNTPGWKSIYNTVSQRQEGLVGLESWGKREEHQQQGGQGTKEDTNTTQKRKNTETRSEQTVNKRDWLMKKMRTGGTLLLCWVNQIEGGGRRSRVTHVQETSPQITFKSWTSPSGENCVSPVCVLCQIIQHFVLFSHHFYHSTPWTHAVTAWLCL